MRAGFVAMGGEISEMREGFTTVHLGMAQITAILTTELHKPDES